ncbi:unnamed protein product [Sphenostylis stenocarpa]|uniref:Uncharacterized protein n=1 Tax=Sphenostylis stenocarpa TaxID=92480 RepID=A0AA86SY01_9FABA|nr:unnamed protein product [Sphenostylis stenocarpa]
MDASSLGAYLVLNRFVRLSSLRTHPMIKHLRSLILESKLFRAVYKCELSTWSVLQKVAGFVQSKDFE